MFTLNWLNSHLPATKEADSWEINVRHTTNVVCRSCLTGIYTFRRRSLSAELLQVLRYILTSRIGMILERTAAAQLWKTTFKRRRDCCVRICLMTYRLFASSAAAIKVYGQLSNRYRHARAITHETILTSNSQLFAPTPVCRPYSSYTPSHSYFLFILHHVYEYCTTLGTLVIKFSCTQLHAPTAHSDATMMSKKQVWFSQSRFTGSRLDHGVHV